MVAMVVNFTAAASQMASVWAQPETRAGGTTTASAFTESDLERNIRNMVEHPALAVTDDDTDGEEEARPRRGARSTKSLGKLRSANTAAIH